MARSLTSVVRDQILSDEVQLAFLAEMIFDGGPVRVWTGIGDLQFQNNIYNGVGHFGNLSNYTETHEVKATTIDLSLSGIPSALVSTALSEEYQGRPCKVWLAFFDDAVSPGGVLEDPVLFFSGRIDTMDIEIGSDTSSISLSASNILVALEHAPNLKLDAEDNNLTLKTLGQMDNGVSALVDENGDLVIPPEGDELDKGFRYVPSLQDTVIYWGRVPFNPVL